MNVARDARLRSYAAEAWPRFDWAAAQIHGGAFHVVVVPPTGPILRVTTGRGFDARARRESETLVTMAGLALPVPIPRLLEGPVAGDDWSASLITRVPGTPADDLIATNPAKLQVYAELLAALRAADPRVGSDLPPPRTWCGGGEWPDLVRRDLSLLLAEDVRGTALDRIAELLDAEGDVAGVVCHGDFGPHNILWDVDRPAGLIDLDHACIGDPAIDLAPLIGFHGLEAVSAIAPAAEIRRAMIHRATLSLQVAAAAHLNGSNDLRDHALRNFATRSRQGTLFEPNGMTPADVSRQRTTPTSDGQHRAL